MRDVTKVHPRACGGSGHPPAQRGMLAGTSPRVRGKPAAGGPERVVGGYIPARAGEAAHTVSPTRAPEVHPRACGGSPSISANVWRKHGTSPRVRGKPSAPFRREPRQRYIPARAGEALAGDAWRRLPAVHPRACGGSPSQTFRNHCGFGTSPRVRGKPPGDGHAACRRRYIPARAGEAAQRTTSRLTRRVHPRACGGSSQSASRLDHSPGTSPRVRGKQRLAGALLLPHGYIPARAGEARKLSPRCPAATVHPRACGGSAGRLPPLTIVQGTSPRVRGKHSAG